MRLLLPRIRDILKADLLQLPHSVKLIDCRPNAWIMANLNAKNYPGIYIWGDSDRLTESEFPNVADRSMKVAITCLQHSSDSDYAAFDEDKGVYALNAAALTVLAENKKLKTTEDPTGLVTGLKLPINIQTVERSEGTSFVIGTVAIVEFFTRDTPWTSTENNETSFI